MGVAGEPAWGQDVNYSSPNDDRGERLPDAQSYTQPQPQHVHVKRQAPGLDAVAMALAMAACSGETRPRVAALGLGALGASMATRLLSSGFQLAFFCPRYGRGAQLGDSLEALGGVR